jgi:ribonuclease HI
LKIFSDGAAKGNPGPASIGATLIENNQEIATVSEYIGIATNNVAEYKALEAALKKAIELGYQNVDIHADSELMIKQLKGEYKVKNEDLKIIHIKIKNLLSKFDNYTLNHVPREKNNRADALANLAF